MNARCPVCRKPVEATDTTGRVWRHNDKAGNWCPMTGHPLPLDEYERSVA